MQKDIGEEIIEKLNELNKELEGLVLMKKNSHIYFTIETDVLNQMKKQAEEQGISLSEWCRKKLKEDTQLNRIEEKLDEILKSSKTLH